MTSLILHLTCLSVNSIRCHATGWKPVPPGDRSAFSHSPSMRDGLSRSSDTVEATQRSHSDGSMRRTELNTLIVHKIERKIYPGPDLKEKAQVLNSAGGGQSKTLQFLPSPLQGIAGFIVRCDSSETSNTFPSFKNRFENSP